MNVWFNVKTNTYFVRYEGQTYKRSSYTAAKELIDSILPNMVLLAKTNSNINNMGAKP